MSTKRIFRNVTSGQFAKEESYNRSQAQEPEEPNFIEEQVPVYADVIDDFDDFFEYEDYEGYEHEYHATQDTGKKGK